MTILPANPPGPARRGPNVSPRLALVAALVVLAAAAGGYLVMKGGGSSSAAAAPSVGTSQAVVPASPAAAMPKISAARLVAAAQRASDRTKWLHVTLNATGSTGNVLTNDLRIGPHVESGTESFDGHLQQVIVIGKVAYVLGDATYLQYLDKFSVAQAGLAAGQWVKLVPGDRPYRKVAGGNSKSDFGFHKPYRLVGVVARDGQQTIEIQGRAGKKRQRITTMYVARAAPHLPLEMDLTDSHSGVTATLTILLSDFGERVRIRAPHAAVSWSQIANEAA